MRNWDFYMVTDSALSKGGVLNDVGQAISAGCTAVQYREKSLPFEKMAVEAKAIAALCKGRADFIVNDHLDVMLASGADGIHIGDGDVAIEEIKKAAPNAIIGVSVRSAKEAKDAQDKGASYVGLGPVFPTSTKPDAGLPVGLSEIGSVKKAVTIPVIAIGGINHSNVARVIHAGADGAAMISAIVASDGVFSAVSEAKRIINESRRV